MYIRNIKKHKRKLVIILILICILYCFIHLFFMPMSLELQGNENITIILNGELSGEASISGSDAITEVSDIVRHMILVPWSSYTVDKLGGDTPTISVVVIKEDNVVWYLYVYDNMALYMEGDSYYYIPFFQRKKIIELCKKYGEIYDY